MNFCTEQRTAPRSLRVERHFTITRVTRRRRLVEIGFRARIVHMTLFVPLHPTIVSIATHTERRPTLSRSPRIKTRPNTVIVRRAFSQAVAPSHLVRGNIRFILAVARYVAMLLVELTLHRAHISLGLVLRLWVERPRVIPLVDAGGERHLMAAVFRVAALTWRGLVRAGVSLRLRVQLLLRPVLLLFRLFVLAQVRGVQRLDRHALVGCVRT